MQPLDIIFPVGVVALVFMGIFTLFLLSDSSLTAKISSLDIQIAMSIRRNRSGFLDQIAPHLGSVYFWTPFYCSVILMLAGFDRVKFLRNCAALAACLITLELFIWAFNGLAAYSIPSWCGTHDPVAMGKCFSLSTGAALSFGLAVFFSLYLKAGYQLIKGLLFLWTLLISYEQIYEGLYYPGTLLLSMIAGGLIATGCNIIFKRVLKNLYN